MCKGGGEFTTGAGECTLVREEGHNHWGDDKYRTILPSARVAEEKKGEEEDGEEREREERRKANGHVGEDSTSGTLHDSHLPSFRTLPQILLLLIPTNRVMRDLEHFHTVAHLFPSDTRDIDDTGAGDGGKGHELGEEVFGGGGDAEAGDEAGERDGKEDGGECGSDVR